MKEIIKIVVVLHNIRSMHNVGSIFRTADAAGVAKVYLCGVTPSPKDEFGRSRTQVSKVSLGAERYVDWEKYSSTNRLINQLKRDGYTTIAVEQSKHSIPYTKLNKRQFANEKVALVMGNEVRGLSPQVLKSADLIVEIPMFGKKESLNISVAFGVVVYHLRSSLV